MNRYGRFLNLVFGALLFITAGNAQAVLVDFSFTGVMADLSTLTIGGVVTDLSGSGFTATGSTVSDIDVNPGADRGVFAATALYDFGGLGAFLTADNLAQANVGGEGYVGLTSAPLQLDGFIGKILPPASVYADPNIAVPIGTVAIGGLFSSNRTLVNLGGDTLSFLVASISEATVTAPSAVPVPAAVWLFGTALIGLIGFDKRRKAA
jgi:hypothetical protein